MKGPQLLSPRIRATEFRLVDDEGSRIVTRQEAEAIAEAKGLDLLVVSLDAAPPVVRLVDYGKYKYEAEKKAREARKKQHVTTVKEIKMSVRIDDNDYAVKVRRAATFLDSGDKVKMTLRLKGREMQHTELAFALAERFVVDLQEHGIPEGRVRQEGRTFVANLSPKPQAAGAKVIPPAKVQSSGASASGGGASPKSASTTSTAKGVGTASAQPPEDRNGVAPNDDDTAAELT